MTAYQFILAIVLGLYLGFARLNQLQFIARDPLLTGIVKVPHLPPQCTLWRFLNSLHAGISRQILNIQRRMREAVWAAGTVRLKRSQSTPTRPSIRFTAGRWEHAGATIRTTRGKGAISRSFNRSLARCEPVSVALG